MNKWSFDTQDVEAVGLRSRGEQERAISERLAVVQSDRPCAWIDGPRAHAFDLDLVFGVEAARSKRNPLFLRRPGEVILRQVWTIVRRVRLGIDNCDRTGVSLSTQHLGRRTPRGTRSDDDHRTRAVSSRPPRRRKRITLRTLRSHEQSGTAPIDVPTCDRVQRRRAQGFARAEREAGVVPRAAHCIADHRALGERPAVVRAGRAHREILGAAPCNEHRLSRGMPEYHCAVRHVGRCNARRFEVWTREWCALGAHDS